MRATSAHCYVTAEARARPNLEIMCDTRVVRILFDGRRVTGIVAERAGVRKTIAAREVVVSAGGIHSPAVLLRSGIGPAEDLRELGIAVVADRCGVGRNCRITRNCTLRCRSSLARACRPTYDQPAFFPRPSRF